VESALDRSGDRRHAVLDREAVALQHELGIGADPRGEERLLVAEQPQLGRLGDVAADVREEGDPRPLLGEQQLDPVPGRLGVVELSIIT